MVAALLGLKALQLSGQIEPQVFRVRSLHVMWCAQQGSDWRRPDLAENVMRRVTAR